MTLLRNFARQSGRVLFGILAGLLLGTGGLLPEPLQAQTTGRNPLQSLQKQFKADSTLPSSSAKLVSVESRLARRPVPAGTEVRAAVVLTVKEGWHVNAHRPTYDYLIGTTLDWSSRSGVHVENVEYPSSKRLELDFARDIIDVYAGKTPIFFDVRVAPTAAPGTRRLTGRLRVQACNDKTCLRPSTLRVELPIPIAKAGAPSSPTDHAVFEKPRAVSSRSSTTSKFALMPLLRRYGALLGGGLLALGTVVVLVVRSWLERKGTEN